MKKHDKKLALAKHTIRQLSQNRLEGRAVVGASGGDRCPQSYDSCTDRDHKLAI
jgi:hypothetical protein